MNHRLPSGPAVIPNGRLPAVGTGNSVITPAGVIRPILFPMTSVNHRLPSGPTVIPLGKLPAVGTGNSVIAPAGVIRPILFALNPVNHRLPSGPAVIPIGKLSAVGTGNSVMDGPAAWPAAGTPAIAAAATPHTTRHHRARPHCPIVASRPTAPLPVTSLPSRSALRRMAAGVI